MAETDYDAVRPLIYKMALLHVRRHGGDYHDVVQDAHVIYLECKNQWNPEGCSFARYLPYKILQGLVEIQRRNHGRSKKKMLRLRNWHSLPDKRRFHLECLTAELSEDAAAVIHFVVYNRSKNYKPKTKETLRGCGWNYKRIHRVFQEIKQS